MAWDGSAVFGAFTVAAVVDVDQVRGLWQQAETQGRVHAALFNTLVTPNRLAQIAGTLYGQGEWTQGRELTSGTEWPERGISVPAATRDSPDGSFAMWNPAPAGADGVTIRGVCGDFLFDVTDDLGLAFHDFGGPVSVTNARLTLTWPAAGMIIINAAL